MSEGVLFARLLEGFVGGPCIRMLGKDLQLKPTTLLVFFIWLVKSLKVFDQLQIFLQYLIELLGLLTGLELLELWQLIFILAFDRVWHACLLHKIKSYGISGHIWSYLLLLSVINDFEWFWMGSFHKNIQL